MYDNFLFRKSWWDIIKGLPSEQRSEVIDYITQYMFEGIEPQFEQLTAVSMAVQFILRDIARDKEYYTDTAEKRKEAGKLGGAPKGNQNARKTTKNNQNNQNKQVDFENNQKQANKQNKPSDIEEEIEYNSSSSSSSSPHARERLTQWVAESGLTDWARQQCLHKGCIPEIDIGALLDEFYNNDFEVREDCEQNRRMEALKHFQNWLPKYLNKLNKLKNDKNNKNNEQHSSNIRTTADGTPANATQRKPYSRISQLANTEFDIE